VAYAERVVLMDESFGPGPSPVPEFGLVQFEFSAFSAQVVGGFEASGTKTLLFSGFQCSSGASSCRLRHRRLFFFLVLVFLVLKFLPPNVLVSFNALRPDLFFGRILHSTNPYHAKRRSLVTMLNFNYVSTVQLTPKTSEPDSAFICVQRVRDLGSLGGFRTHKSHADGGNHLGSPAFPFTHAKSGH